VADHYLVPVCATGGAQPRSARYGAVTLTEQPDLAIASLAQRAGGQDAITALAQDLIGASLPGPGQIAGAPGGVQIMWTGPEQWFVLAPITTHSDIAHVLSQRLAQCLDRGASAAASVTEQTDGWACFALEGEATLPLLERLCRLDVARMQSGSAGRTGIAHIGCFVICDAPATSWRVLGARSSALSLWNAIETVARGLA